MKKSLSFVLALALAVPMIASFALIVPAPAAHQDPFVLAGIKVTDAAGYAAPYAAVDSNAVFIENQAAYVVLTYAVKKDDVNVIGDELIAWMGKANTVITSTTLELSYAESTIKAYNMLNTGAIMGKAIPAGVVDYSPATAKLTLKIDPIADFGLNQATEDKLIFAFIAITKPSVAGEIKAALEVKATEFQGNAFASTLYVYDSTGLKYVIERTIDTSLGDSFGVYTWNGIGSYSVERVELFTYENDFNNARFWGISKMTGGIAYAARVDYFGRIWDVRGTPDDHSDDIDITDTVNAANAFFGFSFAYTNYPVRPEYFESMTIGNPAIVTDTYSYVTSAVTVPDDVVEIAPTGDFSANFVIVMAASVTLAAAALAFVAKKARD